MANVITDLTTRIEKRRKENKNPCKNYATEAAAEKATAAMALKLAQYYDREYVTGRGNKCMVEVEPAPYVVFYIPAWGRWVGCIDLNSVIRRSTFIGGYIGMAAQEGWFSY